MTKHYILLTCALTGAIALQAQTPEKEESQLDRTVVVENLYNPDIMNAHKINILPTLEEPQTAKKQIEYATSANPSRRFDFAPMNNFGATPEQGTAKKGYLRLGYGNRGNVDSRLSYRLDLGKRDILNANIQFRGMDGSIDLPEAIGNKTEWDARTYNTYGSVDWHHRFNPVTLSIEADGENQVFNYLNLYPYADNTHQHNLLGSIRTSVQSNDSDADILYSAGTGLLYAKQKYAFGYYDANNSDSYTETIIRSHAHVSGKINERTSVHIAAQMDNIFVKAGGEYNDVNLTVLQLNPYVTAEGKRWKARAGAHIDPVIGNGGTEFTFAPDIYGEYTLSKDYTVYLSLDGGRELNDFRTVNRFDPYAEFPVFRQGTDQDGYYVPRHTFTQLDSRIGFRAVPFNETVVSIHAGYRMDEDRLFSTSEPDYSIGQLYRLMQDDAKCFYAGASAQYTWKDILTTQAAFEWNKWDSDLIDTYNTLMPEISFRWTADIRPIEELSVGLSYQFQRYGKYATGDRPEAMNNIGVNATYRLLDWLSIYVQGDNLLNKEYNQYIAVPAQGLTILGGAVMEF